MLEKYNFNVYNPSDSIYIRTQVVHIYQTYSYHENLKILEFLDQVRSHEIVYKKY